MQTGITAKTLLVLLALMVSRMGDPAPALPQDSSTRHTPSSAVSSMKVEGELVRIEGKYHVIRDAQGKELYLMVTPNTELTGPLNPGDHIEVWTSPIEHAIAIRAETRELDVERIEAATRNLKGKLIRIEGKYYVMVGAGGKEIRLLVNQDSELAGEFRPGDQIEVFTSPIEHAVAIKSAKEESTLLFLPQDLDRRSIILPA
jgi:hypothetical protein